MLLGGTPDEFTARQRDGDAELQALPPASSSCVLQRLLDRLALRIDLEKLADSVIPMQIIAGLPNHALVKDGLVAGTCAVGVMMKMRKNTTTQADEDEIGAYCVTAVRDFTSILTTQTTGTVGHWIRRDIDHQESGRSQSATRTVLEYIPVVRDWSAEKLAQNNATAEGKDLECRGKNARDDSTRNYLLVEGDVKTQRECEAVCSEHLSSCHAIEYTARSKRCEMWAHFPQMVQYSRGSSTVCLKRLQRQVPVGT